MRYSSPGSPGCYPKTPGAVLEPGGQAGLSVQLPEGAERAHGLRLGRGGTQHRVTATSSAIRTLRRRVTVCGCQAAGRPERRTGVWPRGIRR